MEALRIVYFPSPAALGKWFEDHHLEAEELWVGYFKKGTGRPSVTWPESVDEALCVGWIDGIRKRVDEDRYTIRFTPRKRGSVWSAVNIRRARALIDAGRVRPTGLEAFEARRENRSGIYSYEQRRAQLEEPYASLLKKHKTAWDFFQAQPPSYRKAASWWVVSARKEETRRKRLKKLTEYSARRRRIPQFMPTRVSR
jgi:uncharacterized protein YdeI (YjbR/CyaY-like superfamily)